MNDKTQTYFIIFILFIILSSSCSEENLVNPNDNNGITSISGKIENWFYGDNKTIVVGDSKKNNDKDSFYVFGSSKVNYDGSFSIKLNNPPPSFVNIILAGNGVYNLSDPNAKFASLYGPVIYNSDGSYFNSIYNANKSFEEDYSINDYWVFYQYADRKVSVVANDTWLKGQPPNVDTVITKYKINYQKGWNRIEAKIVLKSGRTTINEIKENNIIDGKWFLTDLIK